MSKIWLCTVTQNQLVHINEMTEDQSWYDGIVAVDHFSTDGTYELLQSRKKNGIIIQIPWLNLHYVGMTAVLQCGHIKNGDWVYFLDSQERVNPDWIKNIRQEVDKFEKDGITCISYNRPILFQKSIGMAYHGNPHCVPYPIYGKVLDLGKDNKAYMDKDGVMHFDYILSSKKDLDNTTLYHGAKYYFYEISNQVDMFYGRFGQQVLQHHVNSRLSFLYYLETVLNIQPNIESFLDYIRSNIDNLPEPIISYIDFEFCVRDAIRLKVLKQTRDEILKKRINWSFRYYLQTKDLLQENNNYIGVLNQYNRNAGIPETP